jgi:hypothetical protein
VAAAGATAAAVAVLGGDWSEGGKECESAIWGKVRYLKYQQQLEVNPIRGGWEKERVGSYIWFYTRKVRAAAGRF